MSNSEGDTATVQAGAEGAETQEQQDLGVRHYKRALQFNSVESFIALTSLSEKLLRQVPGEVVLYPCAEKDASITSRALTSFSMRIRQTLSRIEELNPEKKDYKDLPELFGISTQQSVLLWTDFEDGCSVDRTQRVIRCVVTHNKLYDIYIKRNIEKNERTAELMAVPRPQGRPRIHPETPERPKPPIDPANPQKRGRGRPRKAPEGQDTLL